jgi:hypothetical protein
VHAVDVLRACFHPHQNYFSAVGFELRGLVGREHDFAAGRTRRGRQAGGDHAAVRARIDGRMQKLIERQWIDAQHRFVLSDQAFVGKLDRDAQRRLGGALAVARLQHPQLALLHREFQVLHVAVVALKRVVDARKLGIGIGQGVLHRRLVGASFLPRRLADLLRRADAGDHVLALSIDEEFTVQLALAG